MLVTQSPQSNQVKMWFVVSVRGTAFEPTELTGSASIESVDIAEDADKSKFCERRACQN